MTWITEQQPAGMKGAHLLGALTWAMRLTASSISCVGGQTPWLLNLWFQYAGKDPSQFSMPTIWNLHRGRKVSRLPCCTGLRLLKFKKRDTCAEEEFLQGGQKVYLHKAECLSSAGLQNWMSLRGGVFQDLGAAIVPSCLESARHTAESSHAVQLDGNKGCAAKGRRAVDEKAV